MSSLPSAAPDLMHFRNLGREHGLAAGLASALAGLDPALEAPGGVAVLPVGNLPDGIRVLPHPLTALEGLALVRFPSHRTSSRPAVGLTGSRAAALAAVRIGVIDRLLDAALERLQTRRFAGIRLIDHQLVAGAVADVATEVELRSAALSGQESAEVIWAGHERLTETGWTVARFFGAEGFLTSHGARSLHVSALVADTWIARPIATESEGETCSSWTTV